MHFALSRWMTDADAVDEEARAYIRALDALEPQDYARLTVREARAVLERARYRLPSTARRVCLSRARDLHAVLYAPPPRRDPTGAVLYLHGGGFVMGDATSAAALCERMAADTSCHVLALEYRLAPEARFPAAVDDCVFALRWLVDHAHTGGWDATRLAVAGQSAGGNLAAVTAQMCKHARPALRAQLLICPLTDFRPDQHASRARLAHNSVLSADAIAWFERAYLSSPEERQDPRASPLLAADLAGLAPACVITAAGDPLCDEGEAYARALRRAGVPVDLKRYPSVHGFMEFWTDLRQGELALQRACAWLRGALLGRGDHDHDHDHDYVHV
jgi:acetyl esterase